MGHPLEAVAWIANHLAAQGRGLVYRDVVITGSLITTKTVQAGDVVRFRVTELGEVELRVE
jgi:2-keto-4-pentenoate hydratase